MSISIEERPISIGEFLTLVETLQGLPEIEGIPAHGEVEASCTQTCSGAKSCGASCNQQTN